MLNSNPVVTAAGITPLCIEEAYRGCLVYAARVERCFSDAHQGMLPDLGRQDHFDAVMQVASPWSEARTLAREPGFSRPLVTRYDFACVLFRSFAERSIELPAPLTSYSGPLWDALLGRLYYNPPPREYEFRLQRLAAIPEQVDFSGIETTLSGLASAVKMVRECERNSSVLDCRMKDAFANPCNSFTKACEALLTAQADGLFRQGLQERLDHAGKVCENFARRHPGYHPHYS